MALTGSGAERAAAFSELLDRSLDRSYRLAATILGNLQEGEDATHDAALRAWTAVPSLRDPAKFDAWFQRILVNVCRNRLRARRRPLILEADRAQSVDHQAASAERDALRRAIAELSHDHAIVIVLRYLEDLTIDQRASLTNRRLGVRGSPGRGGQPSSWRFWSWSRSSPTR